MKGHALAAAAVVLLSFPAQSAEIVLARDHPCSVVFMQMLLNGIGDYAVANRSFPPSLETLIAVGFLPYIPPPVVDYSAGDFTARLTSKGQPVVIAGQPTTELDNNWQRLPSSELYTITEVPGPEMGQDGEYHTVLHEQKAWSWRGAEWIDAGYSWDQVALGLKASRLRIVLYWATYDYLLTHNYQLPDDFAELEDYIGLKRHPAGWDGLTLVNSPDELSLSPGAVFVGYDYEGNWRVSANLGPKVQETKWYLDGGGWKVSSTDTYY